MEASSLTALAQEHLNLARTVSSVRSARTMFGGHDCVLLGSARPSHQRAGWGLLWMRIAHSWRRGHEFPLFPFPGFFVGLPCALVGSGAGCSSGG